MLHVSLSGLSNNNHRAMMIKSPSMTKPSTMSMSFPSLGNWGRYGFDVSGGNCKNYGISAEIGGNASFKTAKSQNSIAASSSVTNPCNSSKADFYRKALEDARAKFAQEILFQSKDKDISLAKALLYIAAEDEAFLELHREIDTCSYVKERKGTSSLNEANDWESIESMPMSGKNINEWLMELDALAKEVEAELVPRDIGCDLSEVVEAVNKVLFHSKGFKRSPFAVDSICSYLHSALASKSTSGNRMHAYMLFIVHMLLYQDELTILFHVRTLIAILLSVIYIEVCRRINLTIVGSRVGEQFLIWPQTGNPQELFKVTSGECLFKVVNGKCVDDPQSKASDITADSLLALDVATNRDIIGIALANLIRLYWKRSRSNHGLMLTSPLRSLHKSEKFNDCGSSTALLRPKDLRLAMMASERLLILQPHNWSLRRDYGMMLYYNKEYESAVQELSICMAFAPEEESQELEPFVEKLHLMKLELSWTSLGQKGQLTTTNQS